MQKSLILVSHISIFRQMLTDVPWLLWIDQGEFEWLASFFSYIVPWSRKLFFWKFCTRLLTLLVSFKSQEPRHISSLIFFEFLTGSLLVQGWGWAQCMVDRNRTNISSTFCLAVKGKERLSLTTKDIGCFFFQAWFLSLLSVLIYIHIGGMLIQSYLINPKTCGCQKS